MRQRLGVYLQKSDLVLTEIENYEQPKDENLIDFTPEKTISKNLVAETRLIKKNLSGSQYGYLKDLVSDLEMVFLDISNIEDDKAHDEMEILSGAIAQKDLLTKINLVKLKNT